MGVFSAETSHEQVVFCHDKHSGLRAIIAIYSTTLGPALGGTRFHPYRSEEEALHDVLALSRGMAYKNALAGLDLGGGKAVIWGDPERIKTEPLLRAYGRFVESLGGRYYTACDVGTYVQDMDIVARETRYVTGRSVWDGGAGDSSVLTAWACSRACAPPPNTSGARRRCTVAGWASPASARSVVTSFRTFSTTERRWWRRM
jgi:valine dehydrogenase (NAD+)